MAYTRYGIYIYVVGIGKSINDRVYQNFVEGD